MSGKGRKQWTRETLSSADVQDYLQDQVVMRFPNAAARQSTIPNPTEGMLSTLDDTEDVERHNGTSWVSITGRTWPLARLRQSAAQSGLAGGWADIIFQAEDFDTHDGHAGSAAAWTCPAGQDGTYRASGGVSFGAVGAGTVCRARLLRSGAAIPGASTGTGLTTAGVGPIVNTGVHVFTLTAGQTLTLQGYHNAGTWGTAVGGAGDEGTISSLTIERIR